MFRSTNCAGALVESFRIVAEANRWGLRRIFVPVGREVTAEVDNRDADVPHNLHVRLPAEARTEVAPGPVVQRPVSVAPSPGSSSSSATSTRS